MIDGAPKYVKTKAELAKYMPKIDAETGEVINGISTTALNKNWFAKDDNPGNTSHGYDVRVWHEWALSHLEQNLSTAEGNALKNLKMREQIANIRVQRDKAKQSLRLARIEADKAADKVHNVDECTQDRRRAATTLRARVDSWREHQIAKHPKHLDLIEDLAASFLDTLRGVE